MKLIGFGYLLCGLIILMIEFRPEGGLRAGIERAMLPGMGSCGRCHRPWKTYAHKLVADTYWQLDRDNYFGWIGVKSHTTTDRADGWGSGCFPLCESCWQKLQSPEKRLPYYWDLIMLWLEQCRNDDERADALRRWPIIKAAVEEGR